MKIQQELDMIDNFEQAHIKELYRVFSKLLGNTYIEYDSIGMGFCVRRISNIEDTTNDVQGVKSQKYRFTMRPLNIRDYDKYSITNLSLRELLYFIELIVFKDTASIWEYYQNKTEVENNYVDYIKANNVKI